MKADEDRGWTLVPWDDSHPPLETSSLHPPLRSHYNYVGLKAWQGPGSPRQIRRAGTEESRSQGK